MDIELIDGQEIKDDEEIQSAAEETGSENESEHEEVELPKGYKTKEELIAEGKDPKGWLPPEAFAERKERFKMESKYRKEMEALKSDIDQLNQFHKVQLERQRNELIAKKEDAILVADVKGVKEADKQIAELDKQIKQEVAAPQKTQEEIEWEDENPWIFDENDPRTPIAIDAYRKALSEGKTIATSLRSIDNAIKKIEPPKIERKQAHGVADSSKNNVHKKGSDAPSVSWSSLSSQDEAIYYDVYEPQGTSKSDFLKIVANSRRGV